MSTAQKKKIHVTTTQVENYRREQMTMTNFLLILSTLGFINSREICWIHIQKTSSWLGDYLLKQHCPNFHKSWNEYLSKHPSFGSRGFLYDLYKWNKIGFRACSEVTNYTFCHKKGMYGYHSAYNGRNRTAITIFRRPSDRLISAYLFNGGLMQPHGMSMKLRTHISTLKKSKANVSIETYAKFPGIQHCQTKMVLGYACAKEIPLSVEDLEEAKRRINYDFLFIGLTEFPLQTEQLYRSMFPTETIEIEAFKPRRKVRQNFDHNRLSNHQLNSVLDKQNCSDAYDDQLYEEALKVFKERCISYNVDINFMSDAM